MSSLLNRLERYFDLPALGTSVRTEVLAGATTFLAMSYIIAVNPAILADAGIPPAAAAFATCLLSGIGTIAMGLWARLPLAVAPGMGLNAFFTYTVVQGMGLGWQEALGVVFLSGVVFVLLTLVGVRQAIVRMMPRELLPAIGAGIGLFLMMIGLNNAGLIQAHPATLVTRGDLTSPQALLAIGTLFLIATLLSRGIRAGSGRCGGADHHWRNHGRAGARNRLGQHRHGGPRYPDHGGHAAHVQHCGRTGHGTDRLFRPEDLAGTVRRGFLAGACACSPLPGALRIPGVAARGRAPHMVYISAKTTAL